MRQIKFRTWHSNEMIYIDDFYFFEENGIRNSNDIDLMQFTRLHDENGKKIYEGDILKVRIGGDLQNNYWTVKSLEQLHIEFARDDSYYRFTEVEIVGNIYENPELLEK